MDQENYCKEGRYLYCIVNSNKETNLGNTGIEDNFVYMVPFNDIGAVVHHCEAEPYKSDNKEKAAEWILTHQYVIDLATKEFDTVIPLTFDTIFKGDDEIVKKWLSGEYHKLKALLVKLDGKEEYGVQIFLEDDFLNKMIDENEEIQRLKRGLENKSSGAAYLYRKRLEERVRIEKEASINRYAKELYNKIKELADDVKVESAKREATERWRGKQLILNLACLVCKDRVKDLGNMLGEVNKKEGFTVRFTGPWPPYSFVRELKTKMGED